MAPSTAADRHDPTTWTRTAWRWWLYGYGRGIESGYDAGYRDAMADFLDMATDVADLRPARALDIAAARARRDQYPTPARGADDIITAARASWAEATP